MIIEFDWSRRLCVTRSRGGLAEAVYRQHLTFAVSPKYLSNKPEIYMFVTRIPRVVYIIFWDFFKILFFLPLVDIYRHLLLIALGPMWLHIHKKGEQVVRFAAPLFVWPKIANFVNFAVFARPSRRIVNFVNPGHNWTSLANNTSTVYHKTLQATDIKELNAFWLWKGHISFLYILKKFNEITPTPHAI